MSQHMFNLEKSKTGYPDVLSNYQGIKLPLENHMWDFNLVVSSARKRIALFIYLHIWSPTSLSTPNSTPQVAKIVNPERLPERTVGRLGESTENSGFTHDPVKMQVNR